MGRGKGMLLAMIVALGAPALDACGDVTASTQATANGAGGAAGGATNDARRRSKEGMKERADAAAGGAGGGADDAGGPAAVTDPIDPASTCSICVRAENCCKAQGLTDCNYGALCAHATPTEQAGFYLVLCRAALEASRAGDDVLPDVCSF